MTFASCDYRCQRVLAHSFWHGLAIGYFGCGVCVIAPGEAIDHKVPPIRVAVSAVYNAFQALPENVMGVLSASCSQSWACIHTEPKSTQNKYAPSKVDLKLSEQNHSP
eukprot:1852832-Amphidinium_carterae.1